MAAPVIRTGRALAVAGIIAGLLVMTPLRAEAHARLMSVFPAPSSTVPAPLQQILLQFNEPIDRELFRAQVDTEAGVPGLVGQPVFQTDRTVLLPLRHDVSGALVISWVAIGTDAHPVQGQFVVGVRTAADAGTLSASISGAVQRSGSFESGAGSGWLTGAIEAGRAVEIAFLYIMLGVVLVGALLLPRRRSPVAGLPSGPGAQLASTAVPVMTPRATDPAYRAILVAASLSVVLAPVLLWFEAARITELIPGVGIDRVLFSTIGAVTAAKFVLWAGLLALTLHAARHATEERLQTRARAGIAVLALGLAAAFVAGTHVGTGSATPGWLYIPMMLGHVLLTSFWAGGLLALVAVVFPSRDPERIWAAVSRFSGVMTVSVVLLVGSGVLLLLRLLGNLNALWCTTYGLVAGFKVTVVVLALVVGLVNNRMVAGHRRELELPETARRMMRRTGPSLHTLQRVVVLEACVLLVVMVLAAVLGETQLPPLFNGRVLPGDAQDVVNSGLFGSGCQ